MNNMRLLLIKGLLISSMLYVLSGCSAIIPKEEDILVPPLLEPEVITYKTTKPKIGYIENSIGNYGRFIPAIQKKAFFNNQSGPLKEIFVKSGDKVKKGDLLVQLLTDEVEIELEKQEIYLSSEQKDQTYLEKITQMDIEKAKKELLEALNLYEEMKKGSFLKETLEAKAKEIENLQFNLEKIQLDAENKLFMKNNDLMLATMKYDLLKQQYEKSKLYAPIDGVVTYVASIGEGDYVESYKTIVIVANPSVLQLEYKGQQASQFALGMEVEVIYNEKLYVGEVVMTPASVPVEEIDVYKDTIRFEVKGLEEGVESGDTADFRLVLDKEDQAMIIPRKALKLLLGKDIVYILEDNLRTEKYVELGIQTSGEVQILSGILEEDDIIIE